MAKIESSIPGQIFGGTSIHNDLQGLNDGDYKHLTDLEKIKFDNLPNTFVTNHSELNLDDGTNPHGTTKNDVGLSNVPNLDTTAAVNNEHTHTNKLILDATEESFTTVLKNLYDSTVSWISTNGTNLINHLTNFANPHNVTKSQVGLSNVDNTSDIDKPISTATQTALNLKLDKVSSVGSERVYIINADGSQSTKNTSNFISKQSIRMFHPSWNLTIANTWRTWTRNTSNMLISDANSSVGTGTVPSDGTGVNLGDQNFILVTDAKKLSKINFSIRETNAAVTIELFIRSFRQIEGSNPRGSEANAQILVQQTFTTPITGGYTKINFTVPAHTLDSLTGIQIAYRTISGTATIQGVNLELIFE